MAWIKLQIHPEHDKVLALADLTGASPEKVFAAAVRWFRWADEHAEDASIGLSRRAFREVTRWKGDGLADAMLDPRVDWLTEESGILSPTRWETHMSNGAKVRALAAKRASKLRVGRDESNGDSVTKSAPRPDQTRSELVNPKPRPEGFVSAAPDSVGRSVGPDPQVGKMIRALGLNPTTEKKILALHDLTGAEINAVYASVKDTPGIASIAAVVATELLARRGIKLGRKGGPMASAVAGAIGGSLGNIEQIRRNRGLAS